MTMIRTKILSLTLRLPIILTNTRPTYPTATPRKAYPTMINLKKQTMKILRKDYRFGKSNRYRRWYGGLLTLNTTKNNDARFVITNMKFVRL